MHVRLSSQLVRYEYEGKFYYSHWCSPCGHTHTFRVPDWSYNGSVDKPSFSPSMMEFVTKKDGVKQVLCHYFLTDGVIRYCSDAPHTMAGKDAPLEDIPPEYEFSGTRMKDLPCVYLN